MQKILTSNGKILTENGKILTANVESGGSATVTKQGGWVGTQVPNSGTVENVYFNTNLSVEEVDSYLDSITYTFKNEHFILKNEDDSRSIIIKHVTLVEPTGYYIECITNNTDNGWEYVYVSSQELAQLYGMDFEGWNPNFNGVYKVDSNVVSTTRTAGKIVDVGSENDKLTSLVSITPFKKETETIELSGEYDGATYQATENTIDIKALLEEKKLPLAIKGSGTPVEVSKLPSVGVEGVIYKLNGAPDVYAVAGTEAMSMKEMLANEGFIITVEIVDTLPTENIKVVDMATGAAPLYYSKQDSKVWGYMDGTWVDFILFMFKVDLTAQLVYGLDNITYPTTEGEILAYVVVPSELYKYANGEYVKIDKLPVINSQEWLGTQVPNSGYIEKLYFNTNLNQDEVNAILNELEFVDWNGGLRYAVTEDSNEEGVYITKSKEYDNVYYIQDGLVNGGGNNVSIFTGSATDTWEWKRSERTINAENIFRGSLSFGQIMQNDKLTQLISTTPFKKQITLNGEYIGASYEFGGNGTIDIAEMIATREIPLKIKINVDKAEWLLYRNYTELFNEAAFEIKSYASYSAQSLESINFPNVTHIRTGAFAWCVNLSKINMPKLTVISEQAFMQCQALISLKLVTIGSIYHEAFSGCAKLETVDLGSDLTTLANNAFDGCSSLKKLVIRTENTMIKWYDQLSNCAHFNGTVDSTYNPNGDKDGYIYVPDSLVDTYKNDIGTTGNGWNQYADQIKPLSEYVEE